MTSDTVGKVEYRYDLVPHFRGDYTEEFVVTIKKENQ